MFRSPVSVFVHVFLMFPETRLKHVFGMFQVFVRVSELPRYGAPQSPPRGFPFVGPPPSGGEKGTRTCTVLHSRKFSSEALWHGGERAIRHEEKPATRPGKDETKRPGGDAASRPREDTATRPREDATKRPGGDRAGRAGGGMPCMTPRGPRTCGVVHALSPPAQAASAGAWPTRRAAVSPGNRGAGKWQL